MCSVRMTINHDVKFQLLNQLQKDATWQPGVHFRLWDPYEPSLANGIPEGVALQANIYGYSTNPLNKALLNPYFCGGYIGGGLVE